MHSGLARGEHHDTWIVLYSNARSPFFFATAFRVLYLFLRRPFGSYVRVLFMS